MNAYAFHHSVLEAQRRMREARRWAANERLLQQADVRKPFIAEIAQWVATVAGRLRRVAVTTHVAPIKQAEANVGPLII